MLQDGGKLRLYYRGDKIPGVHWRNGWGKYHENEVTLYAESSDGGVHWSEPNLQLFDIKEMPKGNQAVIKGAPVIDLPRKEPLPIKCNIL